MCGLVFRETIFLDTDGRRSVFEKVFALIEDNRFDRFLSIDKGIQFRLSELPRKYMASSELCELQEVNNIPLFVVTGKLLEELFV